MTLVRVEAILFLEDTSTSVSGTKAETETGWVGPDDGYFTLVQFKVLNVLSTLCRSCTLPVSNRRPFR